MLNAWSVTFRCGYLKLVKTVVLLSCNHMMTWLCAQNWNNRGLVILIVNVQLKCRTSSSWKLWQRWRRRRQAPGSISAALQPDYLIFFQGFVRTSSHAVLPVRWNGRWWGGSRCRSMDHLGLLTSPSNSLISKRLISGIVINTDVIPFFFLNNESNFHCLNRDYRVGIEPGETNLGG